MAIFFLNEETIRHTYFKSSWSKSSPYFVQLQQESYSNLTVSLNTNVLNIWVFFWKTTTMFSIPVVETLSQTVLVAAVLTMLFQHHIPSHLTLFFFSVSCFSFIKSSLCGTVDVSCNLIWLTNWPVDCLVSVCLAERASNRGRRCLVTSQRCRKLH